MKISTIFSKTSIVSLLSILFWIAVWQVLSMVISQEILLVSPFSAIKKLFELSAEVDFWKSISFSFVKISIGFIIAVITGILLSVLSSFNNWFRILIEPLVSAMQAIPVVSFIILFLIWVSSEQLSVFISFMVVFPVVYRNMYRGIESIPKKIKDMLKIYNVGKFEKIRYVYVSETSSYLKSSIEISGKICWKAGIAAEVIGLPRFSIGENLYNAKVYLSTPDLFAWTIAILIISIIFQKLIVKMIDFLVKILELK